MTCWSSTTACGGSSSGLALDPADRFLDADEMADALHGVLSQVAAATDGRPRPRTSGRYSPPRPRLDGLSWQALPSPLLPNHPRIANRVAGVADSDLHVVVSMVAADEVLSRADIAAVARAQCELGDFPAADSVVDQLDENAPEAAEFRAVIDNVRSYLHGVSALAAGDGARAVRFFDDAYASARWARPWRAGPGRRWVARATAPAWRRRPTCTSRWRWPTRRGWRRSPGWPGALTTLGRRSDAAKVLPQCRRCTRCGPRR